MDMFANVHGHVRRRSRPVFTGDRGHDHDRSWPTAVARGRDRGRTLSAVVDHYAYPRPCDRSRDRGRRQEYVGVFIDTGHRNNMVITMVTDHGRDHGRASDCASRLRIQ